MKNYSKLLLLCALANNYVFFAMKKENKFSAMKQLIETSKIIDYQEVFGYNPAPIFEQHEPDTSTAITFAPHGFGGNKDLIQIFRNGGLFSGNEMSFNFPDAENDQFKLTKTYIGQGKEMETTLFFLNLFRKTGIDHVKIIGLSRANAVTLNVLHALHDKTGKYDELFAKLNITPEQKQTILNNIKSVVLLCPLKDVHYALKNSIEQSCSSKEPDCSSSSLPKSVTNAFSWLFSASKSAAAASIATSIEGSAASVTYYKPWKEQGIKSAKNLPPNKYLIYYEKKDEVVSNTGDKELADIIYQQNPDSTYALYGNTGGHNGRYLLGQGPLKKHLQAFNKKVEEGEDSPLLAQIKYNGTEIAHPN